jgi:hypothetical protein
MELFQQELERDSTRLAGTRGVGSWGDFRSTYYDLAAVNAFLGNKKKAFQYLDSLYDRGAPSWLMTWISDDPLLNNIRKEPHFIDFQSKVIAQRQFRANAFKDAINLHEMSVQLKKREKN